MPQLFDDRKIFSLVDVTRSIQRTLADRYSKAFWVQAEMNRLNHYSHSGHCYPDLVEKREGKVIAQIRSSLWRDDYRRIDKKFQDVLREPLKDGIKILFLATIQFDSVHGLSLRILDIDPVYSLGELEREKQESIQTLQADGIFEQNKRTRLALLPQRIAVISVETSKGYSDYLKVLDHNPWGYRFFNYLFPSLLQGERSVPSILAQLKRIRRAISHFDAVAIIRGGGGDVGLSSYNNIALAREVALFPIPVFTGIGHSTNETVVEMVAFKNAITPTELADFLIQKFHDFAYPVNKAEELITERSVRIISDEKSRLENLLRIFQSVTKNRLLKYHHAVNASSRAVIQQSKYELRRQHDSLKKLNTTLTVSSAVTIQRKADQLGELAKDLGEESYSHLARQKQSLTYLERNLSILDPINILRRGFSITLTEAGKAVKNSQELQPNQIVRTIFAQGSVTSKVEETNHD